MHIPNTHARSWYTGKLDGARETLVTLRIIVLQADLEFDGFEEVSLLLVERVVEEVLDVGAHSGCEGVRTVYNRFPVQTTYRL